MKEKTERKKNKHVHAIWCFLCEPNLSFKNSVVYDHHMKAKHQGTLFDYEK